MSAVFGVMARKGGLPPEFPVLMKNALDDWVREDEAIWTNGRVALGNLQFCCERRNLVRQPLESNGLVASVDARLDERTVLEMAVGENSPNDAALILDCYRRWGRFWPERVLGDFAAALYDDRDGSIYLARDFVGVCPLFYHLSPEFFCFASDPRALLALPVVSDQMCLKSVTHQVFQTRRLVTSGETVYPSIKRLLPGHRLTATADSASLERYWVPQVTANASCTPEEAARHLRDLMENAVESRLGDFPTACHLSGGLDSSAIATLASRASRAMDKPIPIGFSWSPPPSQPGEAEQSKVALVANLANDMNVVYSPITLESIKQSLDLHPSLGEKLCLLSELNLKNHMGSRRVLLSGWGGDQAASFDGCGYLAELFLSGRWSSMWRECCLLGRQVGRPASRVFKYWVVRPLVPKWLLAILGKRHHPARKSVLTHYRAQSLNQILPDLEAVSLEYGAGRLGSLSTVRRRHKTFLNSLLQYRLESWALLGGRSGYRYRYPLLDRRIVEFALSLPGYHFFSQGVRRHLFRTATQGLLPDSVRLCRDKSEPGSISHLEQVLSSFFQEEHTPRDPVADATLMYLRAGWQ